MMDYVGVVVSHIHSPSLFTVSQRSMDGSLTVILQIMDVIGEGGREGGRGSEALIRINFLLGTFQSQLSIRE